jgi:hypothetical protein
MNMNMNITESKLMAIPNASVNFSSPDGLISAHGNAEQELSTT